MFEPPPRSNRSVMPRWGEEGSYKFVKLYRKYACLWNAAHPWYKNRQKRNEAFKRIADEMDIAGLTAAEVPKKIKNLRTTYYQVQARVEKSSETDKPYTPSVKWFYDMEYVLKNSNSAEKTTHKDDTAPDVKYIYVPPEDIEEVTDDFTAEGGPVYEKIVPVATFVPPTEQPIRKRQHQENTSAIDLPEHDGTTSNGNSSSLNVKTEEDECDIIGKLVAMQLRMLSRDDIFDASLEIQQVLAKYRKKQSQTIDVESIVLVNGSV